MRKPMPPGTSEVGGASVLNLFQPGWGGYSARLNGIPIGLRIRGASCLFAPTGF
jgi:hypothetical protein